MKIKNLIFNIVFAPKTWHPILFPFVYLIAHFFHIIRFKINLSLFLLKGDKKNFYLLKELNDKGYIVINNYLEKDNFIKLKTIFLEEMIKNSQSKFGNSIRFGLRLKYLLSSKNLDFGLFSKKLIKMSSHIYPWIGCYFEKFKGDDDGQENETFHVDTFHPTFKLFYYPYEVNSFPFEFIVGSQKFSWDNFIFNYVCQIKNFIQEIKSSPLKVFKVAGSSNGSWRYHEANIGISNKNNIKKVKVFKVPENTLIIANTSGFHRRSKEVSGDNPERNMINFIERSSIFV